MTEFDARYNIGDTISVSDPETGEKTTAIVTEVDFSGAEAVYKTKILQYMEGPTVAESEIDKAASDTDTTKTDTDAATDTGAKTATEGVEASTDAAPSADTTQDTATDTQTDESKS